MQHQKAERDQASHRAVSERTNEAWMRRSFRLVDVQAAFRRFGGGEHRRSVGMVRKRISGCEADSPSCSEDYG